MQVQGTCGADTGGTEPDSRNDQKALYITTAKPGEITFRLPLLPFLAKELHVRHGHMIGIDEAIMAEGRCADYEEVFRLTNEVYELVRHARQIHVTSQRGSNLPSRVEVDSLSRTLYRTGDVGQSPRRGGLHRPGNGGRRASL